MKERLNCNTDTADQVPDPTNTDSRSQLPPYIQSYGLKLF